MRSWERLPRQFHSEAGRMAYEELCRRRAALFWKRVLDLLGAAVLLAVLSPLLAGIALAVAGSGPGGVLFRQERIGRWGEPFTILKFRTMLPHAAGGPVTVHGDQRVTGVGRWLRRYHLDELPQLWNILRGEMSFVGPRPEVPELVQWYTPPMWATLLVPVGLTGSASLYFSREEELLRGRDPETVYREQILPEKMERNRAYLMELSLGQDVRILVQTVRKLLVGDGTGPGGKD